MKLKYKQQNLSLRVIFSSCFVGNIPWPVSFHEISFYNQASTSTYLHPSYIFTKLLLNGIFFFLCIVGLCASSVHFTVTDLGPKLLRLATNETNPGLFQIKFQNTLSHGVEMYWNLIKQSPGFVLFCIKSGYSGLFQDKFVLVFVFLETP